MKSLPPNIFTKLFAVILRQLFDTKRN